MRILLINFSAQLNTDYTINYAMYFIQLNTYIEVMYFFFVQTVANQLTTLTRAMRLKVDR